MLIDDLAKAILKAINKSQQENDSLQQDVILGVYVEVQYYNQMMLEIHGEVAHYAYEFNQTRKIYGQDIWPVIPVWSPYGEQTHPNFKIMDLSNYEE